MHIAPDESPPTSLFQKHGQKIIALLLWAGIIATIMLAMYRNELSFLGVLEAFIELLRHPAYGWLVYVLAYVLRPLYFFSSTVLTVLSGTLYGPVWGSVWAIVGSNGSTVIAYYVGRYLGADLIARGSNDSIVQRYMERLHERSFETIMILRLIYAPYDLVSYLAGFLNIRFPLFWIASLISSFAGTVAFALFGASVSVDEVLAGQLPTFNPWLLVISLLIFFIGLGIARLIRRREERAEQSDSAEA